MMYENYKYLSILFYFILFIFHYTTSAIEKDQKRDFYEFPKELDKWDFVFFTGFNLAKLPMPVVEEEISQSPMISTGVRFAFPSNISTILTCKSNYIANFGSLAFQYSSSYKNYSYALGGKFSAWFGHLDLEAIKLKAEGMILSPYINIGYDFSDFLISFQFETQFNRMWTQIYERELGKLNNELSGYAFAFNIEQPLWHNNWVLLGVKFNFTKFFYQSWLSYTTIDEKLLYPEFIFGFIL